MPMLLVFYVPFNNLFVASVTFNYFVHIVFLLAFCKTVEFLKITENDFKHFTGEIMPLMLTVELLIKYSRKNST